MRENAVSDQRSAISQLCSLVSPSPTHPLSPSPVIGVLKSHLPILLRAFFSLALFLAAPQLQLKAAERVRAEDDVQAKVVKLFGAGGLAGLQGYGTGFVI
jgi:hypothetical protein